MKTKTEDDELIYVTLTCWHSDQFLNSFLMNTMNTNSVLCTQLILHIGMSFVTHSKLRLFCRTGFS